MEATLSTPGVTGGMSVLVCGHFTIISLVLETFNAKLLLAAHFEIWSSSSWTNLRVDWRHNAEMDIVSGNVSDKW